MSDDQDWRLQVELADAADFHGRLRDAHHLERELEPLVGDDVVLSHDDDTLFAYASTQAAVDEVRRAIEQQLESDGASATVVISHWDDDLGAVGDWHRVYPPETAAELAHEEKTELAERIAAQERAARIETRTVVISSGRWVRGWFEGTVADEAREAGVELSIVEHPHLLTTQIAFTLTGPAGKLDDVIADLKLRAGTVTRFETYRT